MTSPAPAPAQTSRRVPPGETERRTSGRVLLGGGTILALAVLVANAGNYALNLLLGRWFEPAQFADANLMVTLMLLVTAVAVALQLVSARYAGIHQARGTDADADVMAAWLLRRARLAGVGLGLLLAAPAFWWADVFQVESPWAFVILAAGMPAYLVQAVGRGLLQGRLRFGALAATFVVEMVVRLGVAVGLVAIGFGVNGATAGLSASFIVTWFVVAWIQPVAATGSPSRAELGDLATYIAPVGLLLVGQIIINNGDVLVVKNAFEPDEAGQYSAVALVGRAVFFLSWSAVTTLFPAVAQRGEAGGDTRRLMLSGVAVVGVICGTLVLGAAIAGERLLTLMLGSGYAGLGTPLVLYAIATSIFAVANVIVSLQLSLGRPREAGLLLAGAALQTVLLLAFHRNMAEVIQVQIFAMSFLLLAVAASTLRRSPTTAGPAVAQAATVTALPDREVRA